MAAINTGVCFSPTNYQFKDGDYPIFPKALPYSPYAISLRILATTNFAVWQIYNEKTGAKSPLTSVASPSVNIPNTAFNCCGIFRVSTNQGVSQPFQVVMPDDNIAWIDTYMSGDAEYVVGGVTYAHRYFFRMANLQIDTAEKVTKYDDERGTVIPLSATNYTTYMLQTVNTDAYTLERLMKISNNDHITLYYFDKPTHAYRSVNLIRGVESPSIERYANRSSGSFSCKFVKA